MEEMRLKGLISLKEIQTYEQDEIRQRLQQSLGEEERIQAHILDITADLQSNHEYMISEKAPPVDDMFSWNGYRQWELATKKALESAKASLQEAQERSDSVREELVNCQKLLNQTDIVIKKIETEARAKKEDDEQNQLDDLTQIIFTRRHKSV